MVDVRYHMVGLCPTVLTNVIITLLNILFDPTLIGRNVGGIHRQVQKSPVLNLSVNVGGIDRQTSSKLDFFVKYFKNMFNFSQLIISSQVIIKL